MKLTPKLLLASAALFGTALSSFAQSIKFEFSDVTEYSDFSYSGMSEEKSKAILVKSLEDRKEEFNQHLNEGASLVIKFVDIDMAGEIQPWRNTANSDIRYIEDIYIPRMTLSYTLSKDGEVISEGESKVSDMDYLFGANKIRSNSETFYYEMELIEDFIRDLNRKS